jgi:hypothetical protein
LDEAPPHDHKRAVEVLGDGSVLLLLEHTRGVERAWLLEMVADIWLRIVEEAWIHLVDEEGEGFGGLPRGWR